MHLVHVVKYLWHWPGPVGELVVEGSCQLVSPLLDRRAIIPGSSVLFSGAALSFLTAQQNLLQLLLLPLLLQAPQGAQHQSRLALYGWSDRGERKYTFKLTLAHWVSEEWAQRAAESSLLDGNGDVQDLVGGDEPGHVMPHCSEGEDAGGRAVGCKLTTVIRLNCIRGRTQKWTQLFITYVS